MAFSIKEIARRNTGLLGCFRVRLCFDHLDGSWCVFVTRFGRGPRVSWLAHEGFNEGEARAAYDSWSDETSLVPA